MGEVTNQNVKMIKLKITTQNGTSIELEIPTDGTASLGQSLAPSAVSTLVVEQTPAAAPSEPVCEQCPDQVHDSVLQNGISLREEEREGEVGEGVRGGVGEKEGEAGEGGEEKPERISVPDLSPKQLDQVDLEKFEFTTDSEQSWFASKSLISDFILAFSKEHVAMEFVKARLWLNANPSRRKTARGMGRFLNGWLCRTAGMARQPLKQRVATTFSTDGIQTSEGW